MYYYTDVQAADVPGLVAAIVLCTILIGALVVILYFYDSDINPKP